MGFSRYVHAARGGVFIFGIQFTGRGIDEQTRSLRNTGFGAGTARTYEQEYSTRGESDCDF